MTCAFCGVSLTGQVALGNKAVISHQGNSPATPQIQVPSQSNDPVQKRPSPEAINAANELATQLHEHQVAQMYIGSSKKAFELIASCLNHNFSAADRGFAQSLLATLSKRYKIQRWSSAKPQLSQLGLF
jgi:hypothetical protein